jgi:hypothetical protein
VVTSPTVSSGSLSGVSALSSNAVWAVGGNGSGYPLVEFFNGTSWSVQTLPAQTGGFEAVTAISANDVWAVGQSGSGGNLIENFNGTSWSVVQAPGFSGGSNLTDISAISSTDVFAVGTEGKRAGPEVLQFNGTAWTSLSSLPSGQEAATSVDAVSPTDVWVAGTKGLQNFNGTSWSVVSDPDADFSAISGTSASNIFAVGQTSGSFNGTFGDQWNGTSWTQVTSANPGADSDTLNGVTVLSNGTVVTVGSSDPGGALVETNATTAAPASVSGVSTPASSASVAPTVTVTPSTSGRVTISAPASAPQGLGGVVLGVVPDGTPQGPLAFTTRRR